MIRFEHVSKAYLGGRQALQGVTFHLQPGEMAFLTGHSGAGKSTLLKLICGIERPSAGKIFFSGHDISRLKNREVPFLRRQIGMIFQDHHLLMDRTVFDNVAIPLIIAGASADDIRRRVSAALDKVGQCALFYALPEAHGLSRGAGEVGGDGVGQHQIAKAQARIEGLAESANVDDRGVGLQAE